MGNAMSDGVLGGAATGGACAYRTHYPARFALLDSSLECREVRVFHVLARHDDRVVDAASLLAVGGEVLQRRSDFQIRRVVALHAAHKVGRVAACERRIFAWQRRGRRREEWLGEERETVKTRRGDLLTRCFLSAAPPRAAWAPHRAGLDGAGAVCSS